MENKEIQKIYVVTAGSYSEYHICGVFTERKLAEEYIDILDARTGYCEIEEYEANELSAVQQIPKGYRFYDVYMNKEGNTKKVSNRLPSSTFALNRFLKEGKANFFIAKKHLDERITSPIIVLAKDETHAVKIANERRIQWIANNTWFDTYEDYKKYEEKQKELKG